MSGVARKPETILVTGAAGILGARLLTFLHSDGLRTRALVHERATDGADEVVQGDVTDPASVREAVDGVDAVIHLAAVTHARDSRRYEAVNVGGTRALLAAAPATLKRFVHVSTRALSPEGGAYSRSKLGAEEAVRSASVPWVIVRPGEVYGGGSQGAGVDDILSRARRGAPVFVVGRGDQELCPVHIDDVVPALAAAVSAAAAVGQTYTLAGQCMTVRDFAARVSGALGSNSRVLKVPRGVVSTLVTLSRFVPLPVYPDQLASLEASKPAPVGDPARDLGFSPRSLEEALSR